jgi:hypothetical protein
MDVKEYRKAYEAELAAAENADDGKLHTLAASPAGSDTVAQQSSGASSLSATDQNLSDNISKLLALLASSTEALPVRVAALQALRAALFLGEQFAPHHAEFLQILRQLARPEVDAELREGATEVLASEKDPGIQETLRKELTDLKSRLVSPVKALQLLSLDDHANIVDLALDAFHKTVDLPVKEAALRILATDPKSQDLFSRLLTDKSQPRSLRALSATGLNALNPQKFAGLAADIVKDHGDFEDIRASALGALANTSLHQVIRDNAGFLDAVKNLSAQSPLGNLRAAAGRFLAKP